MFFFSLTGCLIKFKEPIIAYYLLMVEGEGTTDLCLSQGQKLEMKHKQTCPRIELGSQIATTMIVKLGLAAANIFETLIF